MGDVPHPDNGRPCALEVNHGRLTLKLEETFPSPPTSGTSGGPTVFLLVNDDLDDALDVDLEDDGLHDRV